MEKSLLEESLESLGFKCQLHQRGIFGTCENSQSDKIIVSIIFEDNRLSLRMNDSRGLGLDLLNQQIFADLDEALHLIKKNSYFNQFFHPTILKNTQDVHSKG